MSSSLQVNFNNGHVRSSTDSDASENTIVITVKSKGTKRKLYYRDPSATVDTVVNKITPSFLAETAELLIQPVQKKRRLLSPKNSENVALAPISPIASPKKTPLPRPLQQIRPGFLSPQPIALEPSGMQSPFRPIQLRFEDENEKSASSSESSASSSESPVSSSFVSSSPSSSKSHVSDSVSPSSSSGSRSFSLAVSPALEYQGFIWNEPKDEAAALVIAEAHAECRRKIFAVVTEDDEAEAIRKEFIELFISFISRPKILLCSLRDLAIFDVMLKLDYYNYLQKLNNVFASHEDAKLIIDEMLK